MRRLDQLVKRLSTEILDAAKTDKEIQNGNRTRINDLVENKVLPFIDFNRMMALAVAKLARFHTGSTKQLINEFRTLLIHHLLWRDPQIRDQRVEFKPLRAAPEDTEVEVKKSLVIQSRGEPLQLNYRLEKQQTAGRFLISMYLAHGW